jgi:hypothetical protein
MLLRQCCLETVLYVGLTRVSWCLDTRKGSGSSVEGKRVMATWRCIDRPFKKKIKFPRYKFCWTCHLPQDKFMPPTHLTFGKGQDCPHEDFIVFLVIFICQDKGWWKRACEAFGMALNASHLFACWV